MNKLKTAVVVGATGATGQELVKQLLDHPSYQQVITLARRSLNIEHEKLLAHIVRFDDPQDWQHLLQGDEFFSALGSTLKLAGGRAQQYKIDYTYQLNAAQAAKHSGVSKIILVSSPNANSRSKNFYLRMKGELDDAVTALNFDQCVLIKPSIIDANRPEGRPAERIGSAILHWATALPSPLRKYRPISAADLATACINAAQQDFVENPQHIELDALFEHVET